jgi:hypothetical protein
LRPRGSLVVESTRKKGWGPPRSRLGGLPIVIAKREQAWNAWASSNSARELYQQHHNHLSSKERKHVQNFGKCSWKRWRWPKTSNEIKVSFSLALIIVNRKNYV